MTDNETPYNSGADMWHEYLLRYGETEARGICNRYLDMQIFNENTEEIQFCKELYAAMQDAPITRHPLIDTPDKKGEKQSILGELAEKKKTMMQQNISNKSNNKQREI